MRDLSELVTGYRKFLREQHPRDVKLYISLAERGQTPKTMIIACCDSRVDPSRIFSAGPGELFIARNVANLVPPYEPSGRHHGTSAAIEFAVENLEVQNIVVLGHARCGGIRAFLDREFERTATNDSFAEKCNHDGFITKWMSLLRPAWGEVFRTAGGQDERNRELALAQCSIRYSIDNLTTFPFVKARLEAGHLRIHGAYFDIASGDLLTLNSETRGFEGLPDDPVHRDAPAQPVAYAGEPAVVERLALQRRAALSANRG